MAARVLWAIVCGFLLGVFVQSFVSLGYTALAFAILLGATQLIIAALERSKLAAATIFFIFCCAFVLGSVRMGGALPENEPILDAVLQHEVVLEGVVVAEPDVREASVRVAIHTASLVGSTSIAVDVGVLAVVPAHTEIAYGDVVRVSGRLQLPESFDTNYGRQFNYPMYLAKDGILYMLVSAEIESLGENRGNFVQAAALSVKHAFLSGLQSVLPEPHSGLAGGILVGEKRSIGKELTDIFIAVSLIHVVVLSGYNITIVINGLRRGLAWLPRLVQYGATFVAVLLVVLMTGGAPSAVRAGTMSLIAVYARATARTFIAMRILGVVALGMLVWNPMYLAFDPGFQLSVLATIGLVLFTEPFAQMLTWLPERFGVREIVASTIGTQFTVLPLLLYQNGLLSLVALPANVFALVAVPYAMAAAMFAGIAGMIGGAYALPLAAPAYALLGYIIAVAKSFASLPFASISISAFSAWWLLPTYALIATLWIWMDRKQNSRE